jgi:hypothetical protein
MRAIQKLELLDVSKYADEPLPSFKNDKPKEYTDFNEDKLLQNAMDGYIPQLRVSLQYENVYEFNLDAIEMGKLIIYQSPNVNDDWFAIKTDSDIALAIHNTLDVLKTARTAFARRSYESVADISEIEEAVHLRKLSDEFTERLNKTVSQVVEEWIERPVFVRHEQFKRYLVQSLKANKVLTQKNILLQMYREMVSNGKDYHYGCIYSTDDYPMLHFLYKIKPVNLNDSYVMELSYWSRGFLYDYVKQGQTRESIGAKALSLIIDSATAVLGAPIAFINMQALFDTKVVLARIKTDFDFMSLPEEFAEQYDFETYDLVVNTPGLSQYWMNYDANKRHKKCAQCGIVNVPLYRGIDNQIFCDEYCHREYAF